MSTLRIIVRLLICTVIFVPPCCRGFKAPRIIYYYEQGSVINSTNWYLQLNTSVVNNEIQKVFERIKNRDLSEEIIVSNISRLTIGSPVHGQLINSKPSKDGYSESRNAEIIIAATRSLKNTYCLQHGLSDIQCAKDLTKVNLSGTLLANMCKHEYYERISCIGDEFTKYRSYDGSCNNLKRKYLGKADTPYKRLLFPVYIDGVYEMPNIYEEMPPNPRLVSTTFVKDKNSPDNTKTMMMAYWAMFIGHDLSHTAFSTTGKKNRFVNCCDKDKSIQYTLNKNIRSCKPIFIPYEDRFFKPDTLDCMNYVRSRPAVRSDCTFGPMEQMNQATHYLDASMLYGTTADQMLSLREKKYGRLLIQQEYYYPANNNINLENIDTNVCQNGSGTCYKYGDIRANAFPQLNALYILWMKEHNRVANSLSERHENWTDDQIFWEARKIVTAYIQHITYNEWLPALLGVNYTKENGLGLERRTKYNETADPRVSNSFATAILPFANSMITDLISFNWTEQSDGYIKVQPWDYPVKKTLKENYNRPLLFNDLTNYILNGLTMQATQKVDMLFTQTITNYLYSIDPDNSFGMDILSLDIQRSRDHGIPSYTQFRKYCGLEDIKNEEDLWLVMVEGSTDKLLKLYKTWDNIDLLVGALLEKHVDDAMVGPTMRCIIREQFVRTRIADRHFYDVPGVFSDVELVEIKSLTLASVICDNADPGMITTDVFLRPAKFDRSTLNYCDQLFYSDLK